MLGGVTYKLHLVLDDEELMVAVHAGRGAIRKLRDEHVSRNGAIGVFGELVCGTTVGGDDGGWEHGLGVDGLVIGVLDRLLAGCLG